MITDPVVYDTMKYYARMEREDAIMESVNEDDVVEVEVEQWFPLVVEGFLNVRDSVSGYVYADVEYRTIDDLTKLARIHPLTTGQRESIMETVRMIEDEFYLDASQRYEERKYAHLDF